MQHEILENIQKMTALTLENFKKLGEANLRTGEKLLQKQIELTNSIAKSATAHAETAVKTHDVKEVAGKQAEWAQTLATQIAESSRSCAEILTEAGKTYSGIFEAGMKSAGNCCSMDKTAAKSTKAA
jgi:phasin family protein